MSIRRATDAHHAAGHDPVPGMGSGETGNVAARLELQSPKVTVPLKINVTELVSELLPDSPSWYNIGSSVTHSIYWGLRDINHSRPGEPWP